MRHAPPLVISDSHTASAYITVFNSVPLPLPTPCYPLQELSYTYLRMICSLLILWRWALLGTGSSLFSPAPSADGNPPYNTESNQQYRAHAYPPLQLPVAYSASCLASHEIHRTASHHSFCVSRFNPLSLTHPSFIGNDHRTCHHSIASLRSAHRVLHVAFFNTYIGSAIGK